MFQYVTHFDVNCSYYRLMIKVINVSGYTCRCFVEKKVKYAGLCCVNIAELQVSS